MSNAKHIANSALVAFLAGCAVFLLYSETLDERKLIEIVAIFGAGWVTKRPQDLLSKKHGEAEEEVPDTLRDPRGKG